MANITRWKKRKRDSNNARRRRVLGAGLRGAFYPEQEEKILEGKRIGRGKRNEKGEIWRRYNKRQERKTLPDVGEAGVPVGAGTNV